MTCEDCRKEYTPPFRLARFCRACGDARSGQPPQAREALSAATPGKLSQAKQRGARVLQARGLSDAEICERLGVQVKTLYRWRAEGLVPRRAG